jgi:hypothetical protein
LAANECAFELPSASASICIQGVPEVDPLSSFDLQLLPVCRNFAILDYCSLISLNLTLALNQIHGNEC